jgi:ribosomal protein L37E
MIVWRASCTICGTLQYQKNLAVNVACGVGRSNKMKKAFFALSMASMYC